MDRRLFLKNATAAGVGISMLPEVGRAASNKAKATPSHPVIVSSGNGVKHLPLVMEQILKGVEPLDAVILGVNQVENDPNDMSVGYGGLPNERGVVQLDASVMHGPTHNAGAVAALEGIKNPSKVAKLVMERTDHVLLVGEGAFEFAKAHGFKKENLLTDRARQVWLRWKENLNNRDDWLPPVDKKSASSEGGLSRDWGTINCSAVDNNGDLVSVTTTSGLSFKIPGRTGDSPIIGAGLYVDNEVGAAGSTGRGEANLKNLSSFMVVEFMRSGMSPTDACLAVCKRIADHTKLPHLLDENGRVNFNVSFYAVNKSGAYGAACIMGGGRFAVCDQKGARLEKMAYLYPPRRRR